MSRITLRQLMDAIEALAPLETAEAWDNSGLCLGHPAMDVTGVVLSMEADDAALDLAREKGCNVIVAHHPLIFSPVKTLREDTPQGAFLARAIRENVAVYCAHTNFDACPIGPSAVLAQLCGAQNVQMHGFFAVGDVQADTQTLCARTGSPYGCVYGEKTGAEGRFLRRQRKRHVGGDFAPGRGCAGVRRDEIPRNARLPGKRHGCGHLRSSRERSPGAFGPGELFTNE